MPQPRHPLERDPNERDTNLDPADQGASSIGDDAGVFAETPRGRNPGDDDTADSGMDQQRTQAMQQAENDPSLDPPPADFRADSVVRASSPEARIEMESGNPDFGNNPSFTKGHNAPTADQSRTPYTVEQMDEYLTEGRRGVFPDTPGGAGATPLSADRNSFINDVTNIGHFPSRQEAEKWTRSVFNALRQRSVETDDALATEFASVVRVGESPDVQVEEMMWGGDFVDRFSRMSSLLQNWSRQEFYEQVAEEAGETQDDPWVDAAVHSFFGALKRSLGSDADRAVGNLGELQDVWERA